LASDELKRIEELFRLAVESAPAGMAMVDGRGRIVLVNSELERLFGYTRDELLGQPVELLVPETARTLHERWRQGFVAQPRARAMGAGRELHGLRRDGSLFPVEIGLNPVQRHDETLVLAVVADVTERRRSERQLRLVVEAAPAAMLIVEPDGLISLANGQATQMFGYTRDQLVGMSVEALVPGRFRATHPALRRSFVEDPRPRPMGSDRELFAVRADGSEVPVEIGLNPILEGRHVRVLAAVVDISERRAVSEERQRLEESLVQARRLESVGRLAGGVAHDFNNLLTGIFSCVEEAQEGLADDHPLQETLGELEIASRRAAELTGQLLAFARRRVVTPRPVEVDALLDELKRLLRRVLPADVALDVRQGAAGAVVEADPSQLGQVLLNLAVNARDAMPRGGSLTIASSCVELDRGSAGLQGLAAGAYVRLEVADDGAGMDRETLEQIFEPFFTTKSAAGGTGLGLATSYGAVAQAGGRMDVWSEPGRGTCFTVVLPRTEAALPQPAEVAPSIRGTETVLVAEDEPAVRRLCVRALEREGYRVLVVPDGASAAWFLENAHEPIDLLVTDVVLPGAGGGRLAELLAAHMPEARVLFISGYAADEAVARGAEAGALHFLGKPFTGAELARRVREVLDDPG